MTQPRASTLKISIILFIGVFGISTAAVFVRLCTNATGIHGLGFSLFLSSSRLLLSSLIMLPAWYGIQKSKRKSGAIPYAILAGICLAVHFTTWFLSLSYTSIAASTTIVTTTPIWIAILSWFLFKEKPTRLTSFGILLAIGGGLIIGFDGLHENTGQQQNPLLGNFLALIGSWAYAFYFLAGRESLRRQLSTSHYAVIAYSSAALVLLPLPYFFQTSYFGYPMAVYGYLVGMALLAQVIGQTCLNWAIKWISPIIVTLAVMFEPVFSSLLAYPLFGEIPSLLLIGGGVVLLIGVGMAAYGSKPPTPPKTLNREKLADAKG